ncbi:MAG TPA: flagellar motor switch protein FliM [Vicinamibacterales bacterium]|jgi:flagellar motor switch protein FliM
MGKILSQEEIDALLGSAREIEREATREPAEAVIAEATLYNFRRPDRVSKEQIRSLHFLHDRFARNVATSLSAYLRSATDVSVVSVEQFTYSEFLMSLPDPTAFYALSLPPIDGLGALELNPSIAFAMIDRMLGGTGRPPQLSRALTEIEQNVVDSVVKLILENLAEAWAPIISVHFRIHGRETRPQMLQVAAPNEVFILLVFDIKIAETRGMLNLCVPAQVGASFAQGWHGTHRDPTAVERRRLFENLSKVPISISASLSTRLEARDLLALRPGDCLSLGRPTRDPIEVHAGAVTKYTGRPVRSNRFVGVEIVNRLGLRQEAE